ncbi:hypothetical protein GQ53DRAFT_587337, partial [Thozetella sp. PMI_491]
EILAFFVNLVITQCSDALGFVHAISLRWALYRENRLEYNTNFRLFQSARMSLPNRWFMNLLSAACLVLCYASSSMLFMKGNQAVGTEGIVATYLNPFAMCFLGVGLLGQALMAILCMRGSRELIPTWSSNPLVTTLACLQSETVQHRPGRCMLSVAEKNEPSMPHAPRKQQPSLWKIKGVPRVLIAVWSICILPTIWAVIIYLVAKGLRSSSRQDLVFTWEEGTTYGVYWYLQPVYNNAKSNVSYSGGVQCIIAILFLFAIQAFSAVGLHCIELIINMSRDEHVWRRSASARGSSPLSLSPGIAASTSWLAILLVVLKTGLHWLAGQAVSFRTGFEFFSKKQPSPYETLSFEDFGVRPTMAFYMSPARLLAYAIGAVLAAVITTCLALWPRKGYQPAAWGHLQTLADLVDEWPEPDQKIRWGDKGANADGIRHAGTSAEKDALVEIDPMALYAG